MRGKEREREREQAGGRGARERNLLHFMHQHLFVFSQLLHRQLDFPAFFATLVWDFFLQLASVRSQLLHEDQ